MTAPKRLTLAPLDIPVEVGMLRGNDCGWIEQWYSLGLDVRGTLYLIYTNANDLRARISVHDPHWNANHGLRYIDWWTHD